MERHTQGSTEYNLQQGAHTPILTLYRPELGVSLELARPLRLSVLPIPYWDSEMNGGASSGKLRTYIDTHTVSKSDLTVSLWYQVLEQNDLNCRLIQSIWWLYQNGATYLAEHLLSYQGCILRTITGLYTSQNGYLALPEKYFGTIWHQLTYVAPLRSTITFSSTPVLG